MSFGQIVLALYGVLMIAGGIIGYRKAGSKPSLYAGSASGALLLCAWLLSMASLTAGLWLGAIVSLFLCGIFAFRVSEARKFMPSGMLLLTSVIALVLLTRSALIAQGKL